MAVRSRRPGWVPSTGRQLDFNHPLAQGLVGYWDENGQDLVGGLTLTRTKISEGRGAFGDGAATITVDSGMQAAAQSRHLISPPATLVAVVTKLAAAGGNTCRVFGTMTTVGNAPKDGMNIQISVASEVVLGSNNSGVANFSTAAVIADGAHVLTGTFRSALFEVWDNGARVVSSAGTIAPTYPTDFIVISGSGPFAGRTMNMVFHGGAMYNRILSANEIAALSADPFCMFQS